MAKPTAATESPLRTRPEAAAYLRCSETWLKQQVAARAVPFSMVAGKALFTQDDLDRIVARGHEEPQRPSIALRRTGT